MAWGAGWRTSAGAAALLLLLMQGCYAPPRSDSASTRWRAWAGDGFAWAPFGPADANGPGAWYRSLEAGKCDGVANKEDDLLVRALAAVCRAAVEKDQAEWTVAVQLDRQLAARPDRGTPADDCLDAAGEALLARSLDWHLQNPGTDPVVTFARPDRPVACEFKIFKVTPAEGPLAGGTPIEITGAGLNEVQGVAIGSHTVKVDSARTESQNGVAVDILKVTTPATGASGPADVAVRNRAGTAVAPAVFTYLPGPPNPPASPVPPPNPPIPGPVPPPAPPEPPAPPPPPAPPQSPTVPPAPPTPPVEPEPEPEPEEPGEVPPS